MILQHIEGRDMVAALSYPSFHGFVFQSGQHDPDARDAALALCKTHKVMYLYKQTLTRPEPDWVGGGDAWFDFVDGLPFLGVDGAASIAWAFGRKIIGWPELTQTQIDTMVNLLVEQMRSLTPPSDATPGLFLDLTWRRPHPWMFREGGPMYPDYTAETWTQWERRFIYFLESLKDKSIPFLANGDRSLTPHALYREHSQNNWLEDSSAWLMEPSRDVLSVLAEDGEAVFRLVDLAAIHRRKWIGFTGHDPHAINAAYAYAAEVLGWRVGK